MLFFWFATASVRPSSSQSTGLASGSLTWSFFLNVDYDSSHYLLFPPLSACSCSTAVWCYRRLLGALNRPEQNGERQSRSVCAYISFINQLYFSFPCYRVWLYRISCMIMNTVFLGLTLYKFLESARELKSVKFGSMYTIFIGEGVAYFIGCIGADKVSWIFCFGLPKLTLDVVINAVNIVLASGGPEFLPFVDLAQFWLAAYYSYAGCHLILHLRSVNSSLFSLSSFTDCTDLEARLKVDRSPTALLQLQ